MTESRLKTMPIAPSMKSAVAEGPKSVAKAVLTAVTIALDNAMPMARISALTALAEPISAGERTQP